MSEKITIKELDENYQKADFEVYIANMIRKKTFDYDTNMPIILEYVSDLPIQEQMDVFNFIYEKSRPSIKEKIEPVVKDIFETWKQVLIDAVEGEMDDDDYNEAIQYRDFVGSVKKPKYIYGTLQIEFILFKLRSLVNASMESLVNKEEVEEIPDDLEDIKHAENVEFWLENASKCRAFIDKENLLKPSSLVFSRFEKYENVCSGRMSIRGTIDFVLKEKRYNNVTPDKFVKLIKDCDDFLLYISLASKREPSKVSPLSKASPLVRLEPINSDDVGHANLILIRDKIYRFDPLGKTPRKFSVQSKVLEDFFEEVGKLLKKTYVPVEVSCPTGKAIQRIATKISKEGLCNFWSMLVIEILLINKDMTIPDVYKLFDEMSPTKLSNIIYNYWWKVKEENEGPIKEGSGLNAKKIQHMSSSSYKKNKDIQNIGKYRLDKSLSTSESKVFVNTDTGKVVVANRGSIKTLKDWTNNLSLLLGQYKNTQRYKNARDTQVKVLEKYPNYKVLNIGHSQSAKITKLLNEEGLTSEIININPAALPTDKKKDNETTIRSSGDIVSMYDKKKKGDIMVKADTINPFEEHRTTIVNDIPPKTYIGLGIQHHSKFDWFN